MKQTFFNILNSLDFSTKSEIEQKSLLIQSKVYIIGENDYPDYNYHENEFTRSSSDYPHYLGKDFILEEVNYKLNELFLKEVLDACIEYFKTKNIPLINDNIETIKLQIENSGESLSTEIIQQVKKSYNVFLSHRISKELHKTLIDEEELHYEILKRHLRVNWYDLSDYLFGLGNIQSYRIVSEYHTFIRSNMIFNSVSIGKGLKVDTKLSLPKSIALLNEIGFFKLDYYKNLETLKMKHKLVVLVLDIDYKNKNVLRSIEGNINVLDKNSLEDRKKFTSETHSEKIKKIISEVLNS